MILASTNVILLNWGKQQIRLTIGKEEIWITYLELDNKIYVFLSSKILSNSVLLSSNLPNFTA